MSHRLPAQHLLFLSRSLNTKIIAHHLQKYFAQILHIFNFTWMGGFWIFISLNPFGPCQCCKLTLCVRLAPNPSQCSMMLTGKAQQKEDVVREVPRTPPVYGPHHQGEENVRWWSVVTLKFRLSFYLRLREKAGGKADKVQYEHMNVVGHLKTLHDQNVFVGLMRPVKDRPITELSLIEATQDQYITRHLPDGRIIYSDHRISTIAGNDWIDISSQQCTKDLYDEIL